MKREIFDFMIVWLQLELITSRRSTVLYSDDKLKVKSHSGDKNKCFACFRNSSMSQLFSFSDIVIDEV